MLFCPFMRSYALTPTPMRPQDVYKRQAILMRPSKSTLDLTTRSLKKKFKDKKFAAGCSREVIQKGVEMLGWDLEYLMEETIKAMQEKERNEN